MDGSFGRNLDLSAIFWWAVVGVAATTLAGLAGFGWLIWFIIHHIQIV